MEKFDIVLWVFGVGFTFTFGVVILLWNNMNQKMDRMDHKIDKLDEKLTDVDRRLCRLEGAFASKDCCMIKDERQMRKAE